MAQLERIAGGEGWSVGRVGNSAFLSYRVAPLDGVRWWYEAHERAIALHPGGIIPFTILEEAAAMPSADVLQAVARRFRAYVPSTIAVATVFEGSSLSVSVKRAAVTMVQAMLPSRYPVKTFRTLSAACDFAARYARDDAGQPLTQPALLAAFSALRTVPPEVPSSPGGPP
jgi:hypothetical protein